MPRPNANHGGRMVSRQQPLLGLSILEFMGCLTAVAGGLLLGALYLGVDVKMTTMELLQKADLIDTSWLADEREDDQPQPTESDAVPTQQAVAGKEASGATDDSGASSRATPSRAGELSQSPTQKYWHKLLQVMQRESAGRQENAKGQLFEYLTARQQRHQQAADAIANLGQSREVDEKILAYAELAIQWQQSGSDLYGRASQLLTVAPASEWSGPFAQSWQSAATQHRMEEKLLLAKQNAVSQYLDSPSFAEVLNR